MHIPDRPIGNFDPDHPTWQQWVFEEASYYDSTIRDIAALAGVPLNTFSTYRNICGVIATGRAVYRRKAAVKMSEYMFTDVDKIEDPAAQMQMRNIQVDLLKHWSKLELKREEMASLKDDKEKDRDAISKLTTEELKQRAQAFLK